MIRLFEDAAKQWLHARGLPVPRGEAAETPEGAGAAATRLGGATFVKALVLAGRRGKADAVRFAASAEEATSVARALLDREIDGQRVARVYVEEAVPIHRELYLAFTFDHEGPRMLAAGRGGVDIEELAGTDPDALVARSIDPIRGLQPWQVVDHWHAAGIRGEALRDLAALTVRLYDAFRDGDAELLELNPLALDPDGRPMLVGVMAGLDGDAAGRHPEWPAQDIPIANPRERQVAAVNTAVAGGECRYVELDGDIGLLVGGGGAGLYQHDRLLAAGGRPANHSVTPPTGQDARKLKAVIEAIVTNPRTRALLVGFNFAQMARADIRVRSLLEVLDEKRIDTTAFPVVIRLFGAGEAEARQRAANRPGIHYLPRDATLDDAVRLVSTLAAARCEADGR
jgi:succinyl-CoA synthetase beta subunit